MLKVYSLTLKNTSILQLGTHELKRFMYFSEEYIPSYALRGALGARLFKNYCLLENANKCLGNKCQKSSECFFYKHFIKGDNLFVTPAYPSLNDCKGVSVPACYLFSRCKICGYTASTYDMYLKLVLSKQTTKTLQPYKRDISVYHRNREGKICGLSTLEPLDDEYYCLSDKKLIPAPKRQQKVSIGINRKTGTTEEGLLYLYDGIRAGYIFKSELAVTDEEISKFVSTLDNEEISLGRGKSRGFGVLKVSVKEKKINLDRRADEILESFSQNGDTLVAIAVSPLFEFTVNEGFLYSTANIDLKKAANLAAKKVGIKSKFTNNIEHMYIFGGTTIIGGWSLLTLQPKTRIRAISAGSLLFIKLKDNELLRESATALAALELVGYSPINNSGFGILRFVNSSVFNL